MSQPRVVIITGCSTGIGLSAAILLAKHAEGKFKVYATMRNLAKKDELLHKAGECFNRTLFVAQMDVCSETSVAAAVKQVLEKEGRVDVLINNAGTGLMGALEFQLMEEILDVYETNVHGVIRTTRAVLPSMKQQKSGHIINIGSLAGLNGYPFSAVYCSSKFALEGLSESLAPELAQFNIHMSLIAPGPVSTAFSNTKQSKGISGLKEADDGTKKMLTTAVDLNLKLISSSETCQAPDEVAGYILTALNAESPHFRYITSKVLEESVKKKYVDVTGDETVKTSTQRFFDSLK